MEFKFWYAATVIAAYTAGSLVMIAVDNSRVRAALRLADTAQQSIEAAKVVKGTCTNEAALRWWSEGKDLDTVRGKLCGVKLNPKLKQ